MRPHLGRDRRPVEVTALRTGPRVGLVFRDDRRQFGQFGKLMPGRLGVSRLRFRGQDAVAVDAGRGQVGHDLIDAVLRQALAAVAAMPRLPAGLAARGGLGHRLGGAGRVGRGRDRGVGGVAVQVCLESADLGFQGSDPLVLGVQQRTQSRTLGTARTRNWGRIAHESPGYRLSNQSQED